MNLMDPREKADHDNHSNQLNPNNDAYWQSRGYDDRPDDWENDHGYPEEDDYYPSSQDDSFESTCWSWDD